MPSGPQRAGDSASPAFGGRVNGPLRYGLSPQGGRRRRDASPVINEGDIGCGPYLSERTLIGQAGWYRESCVFRPYMGMKGFFYLPGLKEAYIMDKEKNTRLPLVDLIEVKPMQDGYRWVAITAMLFAIGIILHTVSPNVGGVTPNWTIAMYSIVINLTNPTLSQAVGIGFIAGITLVPSSKSAFPLGNIASELSGAITCCILVKAMLRCGLGKWKLRPLVTGFLATMASGGVFTFILKIVLDLPLHVWLYAMLPVVAIVGALNGMITFLQFGPVRKLFFVQEDDD